MYSRHGCILGMHRIIKHILVLEERKPTCKKISAINLDKCYYRDM